MKVGDLLTDRREVVRKQAEVLVSGLKGLHKTEDIVDQDIEGVIEMTALKRGTLPDKSSDLSKIDAVLVPLMQLHRVAYLAQPVEEQLEPSELDLLSFGITREDLEAAASELSCTHLGEPAGPQPTGGLIYGIKDRMLVVRDVQIRRKTLSVTFILDTGAPRTYICYNTARAFDVDPEAQASNHIRASFARDVTLDVYFFDPEGPHNELNVLGMDYMMATNCKVEVNGRQRTATLTV